jgi:hypothetical protein
VVFQTAATGLLQNAERLLHLPSVLQM